MSAQEWTVESLPVHPHVEIDRDGYRLALDGLVRDAAALPLAALQTLPQVELAEDFGCLEGWTAPGQRWQGVSLRDLLDRAGLEPGAQWVQASFDGFSVPISLSAAQGAVLALSLNGAPLPSEHGGPVRLVVPGGDCFTSVKWIDHLEVRAQPDENTARRIATKRIGLNEEPDASA